MIDILLNHIKSPLLPHNIPNKTSVNPIRSGHYSNETLARSYTSTGGS